MAEDALAAGPYSRNKDIHVNTKYTGWKKLRYSTEITVYLGNGTMVAMER